MIVQAKRGFTTVKHGKATIDVSEQFDNGENVEVVVFEDCGDIQRTNKEENSSPIRMVLEVSDEAYPHLRFLFEHMDGVEIVED